MSNLNDKALLVNLKISQWTARKYDKKATQEVINNHGASDKIGRFNKSLLQGDVFKRIGQIATAAREFHYDHTLPWLDNGLRVLPVTAYETYTDGLRRLKDDFDRAVREFVREYPALKAEAKIALNGLYRESDYPVDVESRYRFDTVFAPVPSGDDFRVHLPDDEIHEIARQAEERLLEAEQVAIRDIWDRLRDAVGKLVSKLNDEKGIFRDTLITNVHDLIDVLPLLNLGDDPSLDRVIADLRASVSIDPQSLREDQGLRKQTASRARDILKDIDSKLGL